MADPGQKFQVTDVVLDRTLPFRRLVFAGTKDDIWFVHYEHGGIAHRYYVIAFKLTQHDDADFIWGCSMAGVAKSVEQLRAMVASCRPKKANDYW